MSHYTRFMKYFPGKKTIQVFGDKTDLVPKILQEPCPSKLIKMNKEGYGIFMTINETDGKGRSAKNVVKIRAIFSDLDGQPVGPAMDDSPHLVVESSKGKFHAYWFTAPDFPLEAFTQVQKGIALKYSSDGSVHDLSRVLRVPGFMHQKKEPYPVRIVYENPCQTKISFSDAVEKWPPAPAKKWTAPKYNKPKVKEDGFEIQESIPDLLKRFGWKQAHNNFFTRHGKDHGISGAIMESGLFYCFTDATPLKPNQVADAFEILSAYQYSGDKRACALALRNV